MLNKDTLIKIAVALLVIAVVYLVFKSNKKRKMKKPRKVIVTAMPTVERYDDMDYNEDEMETYDDEADDEEEEGYASWNTEGEEQEDFDEMSPVEFKSELLD